MLYLISGTSRSGKTIIARNILERKKIPYLSLDWLVMGFTNGIPEYGVHDKLFPDEIAEKLRNFLQAMCESMLWSEVDYVIEGEAILPDLARILLDKHPGKTKTCFVGYTDIDIEEKSRQVKDYSSGKDDWLIDETDDYIFQHIDNMVTHSRKIKDSCKRYNIRYFDTSVDFISSIEKATTYLLGNESL